MTRSVLRPWVTELPLRHQGGLVVACRGYDGQGVRSKPLVRAVRFHVLNPADEREVDMDNAFMARKFDNHDLRTFFGEWETYTLHFAAHLMHGCEIIGYKHPEREIRDMFEEAYGRMVMKLHLNHETEVEMDARLTIDRIAIYGAANAP